MFLIINSGIPITHVINITVVVSILLTTVSIRLYKYHEFILIVVLVLEALPISMASKEALEGVRTEKDWNQFTVAELRGNNINQVCIIYI